MLYYIKGVFLQQIKKYVIIPDVHVPYHDKKSWALLLKSIAAIKPYGIVILGDFLDNYCVSSHSKDPNRAVDLKWEVGEAKKLLGELNKIEGVEHKIFIAGNHENRLERYLAERAPALFNIVKTEELLELTKNGWKYVDYKDYYRIGKVNFTHDTGKAGKYAHYQSLADFQASVVIGHTHRFGYAIEGNAKGKPHVTAMLGWLGDVSQIDYMHRIKAMRDWAQGFGIGYLLDNGNMHITPVPIIEHSVIVEGKLIK